MTATRARKTAWFGWTTAALYAGGIFLLSSRSPGSFPRSPFPHGDKLVHAALYGGLGALVALALGLRGRGLRRASLTLAAVALALVVAYGVSDELHQALIPGRQTSLGDLAADTFGAAVAIVLVARPRRRSAGHPAED